MQFSYWLILSTLLSCNLVSGLTKCGAVPLNPSMASIYVCSRLLYADQSHCVIAVKAEKSSVFLHFVLFRSQIIHEKPKP